jgi:predicted hydrocarbon binding protein
MAREFLYWFGYSYGEKVAERYLSMGIPKEIIPKITAAISTFVAGWGIPEFLELSLDRGRLVVKLHNDFESESAQINGSEPTNSFFRGMLAALLQNSLAQRHTQRQNLKMAQQFLWLRKLSITKQI